MDYFNVIGIVSLVFFYLLILAVGILAAWKVKVKGHETGGIEVSLVAGRDLRAAVGIFTMIATTVGGGYINGTSESIAKDGLVWTLAPLGIFVGLSIGGTFYAGKMRERKYMTMLDPFQQKYGSPVVCLIYLASLMGDLLWTASILNALGTTLSVIVGIPLTLAVIVSGSVSILYTMVGSMISVAYTDILQLTLITVGLVLSLPFILTNDNVGDFSQSKDKWLGRLETKTAGLWSDLFIAMTLGTIPWQAYFQRVLSVRSVRQAQLLSFVAAGGALVLVIPSVVIGMAATSANWTETSLGHFPNTTQQLSLVLPLVIHEFTPGLVSICGLGAISAAVMSSVDSSVLATSSMFSLNIYHKIFRPAASRRELKLLHMISVLTFGCAAIIMALTSSVIYGTFILAADIVFVTIFPQLSAVLFFPQWTNSYGATAGFLLGLFLRLSAGEPLLELPELIQFWWYDANYGQLFPYRTLSMLLSLVAIVVVTVFTRISYVHKVCQALTLAIFGNSKCGKLFCGRESMDLLDTERTSSSEGEEKRCIDGKIVNGFCVVNSRNSGTVGALPSEDEGNKEGFDGGGGDFNNGDVNVKTYYHKHSSSSSSSSVQKIEFDRRKRSKGFNCDKGDEDDDNDKGCDKNIDNDSDNGGTRSGRVWNNAQTSNLKLNNGPSFEMGPLMTTKKNSRDCMDDCTV